MMFQEIHLDDRMTTDSHICKSGGSTNTIVSSFDSNTAKVSYEKKNKGIIKKKHFLLCESCFWCASSIYIDRDMNTRCPVCYNINVESIPI